MYLFFGGLVYFFISLGFFWVVLSCSLPVYLVLNVSGIRFFDFFFLGFFFDYYSLIYLFVLFSIVSGIHLFIFIYMGNDSNLFRFFSVLNIFVFSMVILILSPNLISLMLGWDGLGFSSFLLVAWFGCFSSRFSSLKTFLVNRLGDGLFLVSLYYFFFQGHFFLFSLDSLFFCIYLVLVFSFFTKSAHFPFSSWLPDAMAAPTPVSALVHSSTLVTAGLYLLFRFSYVLSWYSLELISYLGLWTLFIGSMGACFDNNSKKVVAYSTISQLGFMSFVLSIGCFDLCFSYMMVHALFKALLFISVGCLLVLKFHNQDLRHLNNCWGLSPVVTFNFFFSCFSLSGFPFFSGYYIKEVVINSVGLFQYNYILLVVFFFSLVLTSYYSFRLFFFISFSYSFSYGVIVSLGLISNLVFSGLYISIIFLGLILFENLECWVNFGPSLLVILVSVVGVFCGSYVLKFNVFLFLKSLINYFVYMFFLNIFSVSLNSLYQVGGYLVQVVDSGFFLFSFINKLDTIFRSGFNVIISFGFFSNWLSLVGLSFIFIGLVVFF
uniref:NADH:ubiquinone reductase (H(+)-translocating) n=1 Tax=Bipalium vagum TaxID=2200948 RepID=A0A8K1XU17_9PLAT|nr:NADH dehydrogenase subunit 5 [Bipalium vagum]